MDKCCRAGQATDEIWRMRIACWIPKVYKYTHSVCVILIAFLQQQWLHERAPLLYYTYIVCLVFVCTDVHALRTTSVHLDLLRKVSYLHRERQTSVALTMKTLNVVDSSVII
jgi:hypothetical protein